MRSFVKTMGVFEYPWQEDYDMVVEHYGERFEPIQSVNPLPLQSESPTQRTHQTFVIDSALKLTLSSNWQCTRVKSFHVSFQIFANNDIFDKANTHFQLQSFSSDKNFLFCTIVTFRKHPLSLDDYIPDKNHGEELNQGIKAIDGHMIKYVAHSILGKNLALISVIKELPFEADKNNIFHTGKNHQYIHLIGLSNIGGYEDAMQQMIDCVLSVRDST